MSSLSRIADMSRALLPSAARIMAGSKALREYLDAVVAERYHGNISALARDLKISPSSLGRQIKLGQLGTENALRLAKHLGESPSNILRLADKTALADLIEELYGTQKDPVSDLDRRLLSMPERMKEVAASMADLDLAQPRAPSPGRRTVRR